MIYSTWDTLLTPDDFEGIQDQQEAWESAIEKDQREKLRIPIKAMDPEIKGIEIQLSEPEITDPKGNKNQDSVTIIKTGKKKNKGGLF